MNQKERAIFTIQALIKTTEGIPDETREYLLEKVEAMLPLARPNKVVLSEHGQEAFNELEEEARRKGLII